MLPALPRRRSRFPAAAALAVLAGSLAAAAALAQAPAGVPLMKEPLKGAAPAAASAAAAATPAARPGTPRTINWEALVPAGWDPFKDFKGMDFQTFDDADPRAMQFLKRMREVWDNAPANPQIAGQDVRIPGFVVPLEEGKEGVKEFLLVPYFGACIHSPPPPANQIIHVLPKSPAKGVRSMDAVWISGRLATVRTDSFMGAASYRIEATEVAPYREGGR
ncbi:MAG: DUF3299 domain-containing protein [Rubrivivax sp.]|nr:DUF3299 domain-containing protein [Rubrivivax sp.]